MSWQRAKANLCIKQLTLLLQESGFEAQPFAQIDAVVIFLGWFMEYKEHRYEDVITCPYCDYRFTDSEKYGDFGMADCPKCDRRFNYERMVEFAEMMDEPATYSSETIDSDD